MTSRRGWVNITSTVAETFKPHPPILHNQLTAPDHPKTRTMRRLPLARITRSTKILSPKTKTSSFAAQRPRHTSTSAAALPTTSSQNEQASRQIGSSPPSQTANEAPGGQAKKTMAELDEELRLKMEGMSGEGGSAGVEYENGRSEGLKRGVKANMFRVI